MPSFLGMPIQCQWQDNRGGVGPHEPESAGDGGTWELACKSNTTHPCSSLLKSASSDFRLIA